MRYAVPASLWHRPKPSVAWAFGGVKVHRTFTGYRLTPRTFILARFHPGTTPQRAVDLSSGHGPLPLRIKNLQICRGFRSFDLTRF